MKTICQKMVCLTLMIALVASFAPTMALASFMTVDYYNQTFNLPASAERLQKGYQPEGGALEGCKANYPDDISTLTASEGLFISSDGTLKAVKGNKGKPVPPVGNATATASFDLTKFSDWEGDYTISFRIKFTGGFNRLSIGLGNGVCSYNTQNLTTFGITARPPTTFPNITYNGTANTLYKLYSTPAPDPAPTYIDSDKEYQLPFSAVGNWDFVQLHVNNTGDKRFMNFILNGVMAKTAKIYSGTADTEIPVLSNGYNNAPNMITFAVLDGSESGSGFEIDDFNIVPGKAQSMYMSTEAEFFKFGMNASSNYSYYSITTPRSINTSAAGLAGRLPDDYSAKLTGTKDNAPEHQDHYLSFGSLSNTAYNQSKALVVDFSYMPIKNVLQFHFTKSGGTKVSPSATTAAHLNPGKWNKMRFVYKPPILTGGKEKMELYVNGKSIGFIEGNAEALTDLRFNTYRLNDTIELNDVEYAIDDIRIWQPDGNESLDDSFTLSYFGEKENSYWADDEETAVQSGGEIYLPQAIDADELANYLNLSDGTEARVFHVADGVWTAADVADEGTTLVLVSPYPNGVYTYYDVHIGTCNEMIFSGSAIAGQEEGFVTNGTLTASIKPFDIEEGQLILAMYSNDNSLLNVVFGTNDGNQFNTSLNVNSNVKEVRAFFWDMSGIKPILDARMLKYYVAP